MKIVLIGFMGAGKSSVAAELAKKLQLQYIETDALVLAKSGKSSISQVFSQDGEVCFRELEMEVAKALSKQDNVVISTGGGMVQNKLCIDYLRQNGLVIYLSATFSEIEKRLRGDTTRPLFLDKTKANELYKFRKQLYEMYADMIITTDKRSISEITNLIVKKI
jgi:shikimate kinase